MGNIHAEILSPSASVRWIHCPKSILFEKGLKSNDEFQFEQQEDSKKEGSKAHKVAELLLKKRLNDNKECFNTSSEENGICKASEEMSEYGEKYADYVYRKYKEEKSKFPMTIIRVESVIDCSEYVENCIGTPDVFIIGKDTLRIIDYKYGKIAVRAETNSQLRIYALGVLSAYSEFIQAVKNVEYTIIQPRRVGEKKEENGIETYNESIENLIRWGENELRPAGVKANQKLDEEHPGDWCEYCRGQKFCEAYYWYKNCKERGIDPDLEDMKRYERVLSDDAIKKMENNIERVVSLTNYLKDNVSIEKEQIREDSGLNLFSQIKDYCEGVDKKVSLLEYKKYQKFSVKEKKETRNMQLYCIDNSGKYKVDNIATVREIFYDSVTNEDNQKIKIFASDKDDHWILINTNKVLAKVDESLWERIYVRGGSDKKYVIVDKKTYENIEEEMRKLKDYCSEVIDLHDKYMDLVVLVMHIVNPDWLEMNSFHDITEWKKLQYYFDNSWMSKEASGIFRAISPVVTAD